MMTMILWLMLFRLVASPFIAVLKKELAPIVNPIRDRLRILLKQSKRTFAAGVLLSASLQPSLFFPSTIIPRFYAIPQQKQPQQVPSPYSASSTQYKIAELLEIFYIFLSSTEFELKLSQYLWSRFSTHWKKVDPTAPPAASISTRKLDSYLIESGTMMRK